MRQAKLAEGALQSTEARHRALFSFLREAIFVADAETGMVVDANPGARVVLTTAYTHDMVIGSFKGVQISGFIRKPYQLAEVAQVLQGVLSR